MPLPSQDRSTPARAYRQSAGRHVAVIQPADAHATVGQFLEAAARRGFTEVVLSTPTDMSHIGSWVQDVRTSLPKGSLLGLAGITLGEDPWLAELDEVLALAGEMGARTVDVRARDPLRPRLVGTFTRLCGAAQEHGLRVGLEVGRSSQVKAVGDGLALIRRSEAENARLTIDTKELVVDGSGPGSLAVLTVGQLSSVRLTPHAGELPATAAARLAQVVHVVDPRVPLIVTPPTTPVRPFRDGMTAARLIVDAIESLPRPRQG